MWQSQPTLEQIVWALHSVKSSWFDFLTVWQEFSFQNIMVRSHLLTVTNITIVEWQHKSRRTPWFALGGLSIKLNNIEQHFDFYQAVNCQLSTIKLSTVIKLCCQQENDTIQRQEIHFKESSSSVAIIMMHWPCLSKLGGKYLKVYTWTIESEEFQHL